jgi:MoxR-like ATPase
MSDSVSPVAQLRAALARASAGLVEREVLVELVALCAVAGEHLLVIGPPGTAKSEAVRRVARVLGGRYFEYLLGRFTEPSEIFGPIDLRRLREGVVETQTTGMLPEADIAFLDEVFLGSTAILNTLLALLNERTFRRGHTEMASPLRLCVGAANSIPEDESLAAFSDRFLVRLFVEPLPDPRLEELLEGGWSLAKPAAAVPSAIQELDGAAVRARDVDLQVVRPHLAHAIRKLRGAGLDISDRRAVKMQKLVAAAATMADRTEASLADLWPIVYALPTAAAQGLGRDVLRDALAASENAALANAAADASQGPLARATRLVVAGNELLAAKPESSGAAESWRLRLESVAREIDAGFATDQLPPELKAVRTRLIAAINPSSLAAA